MFAKPNAAAKKQTESRPKHIVSSDKAGDTVDASMQIQSNLPDNHSINDRSSTVSGQTSSVNGSVPGKSHEILVSHGKQNAGNVFVKPQSEIQDAITNDSSILTGFTSPASSSNQSSRHRSGSSSSGSCSSICGSRSKSKSRERSRSQSLLRSQRSSRSRSQSLSMSRSSSTSRSHSKLSSCRSNLSLQSRSPSKEKPKNQIGVRNNSRSKKPRSSESVSSESSQSDHGKANGNSYYGAKKTLSNNACNQKVMSKVNKTHTNGKATASRRPSSVHSSRSRSVRSISSGSEKSSVSRHRSKRRRFGSNSRSSSSSPSIIIHKKHGERRHRSPTGTRYSRDKKKIPSKSDRGRRSGSVKSKPGSKRAKISTRRSPCNREGSGSDCSRRSNYSRQRSTAQHAYRYSNRSANFPGQKSNSSRDVQTNRATSSKVTADSKVAEKLTEVTNEINQRLKEFDRRLHRMEVTLNKTFVLVGDLNGHNGDLLDDIANDQGYELPELPIEKFSELTVMEEKLKDKDFRCFYVSCFDFILFVSSSFTVHCLSY